MSNMLSIEQCVSLACFLEATAPKPGNVHRGADFDDLTFPALVTSGIVIAPIVANQRDRLLGEVILYAVKATRDAVGTNSNLGMILLLAPLAAVPPDENLAKGIARVLKRLGKVDAQWVYAAIGLAKPGGMGTVPEADLSGEPPESLIEAMRLAADRDLVARQYANGFRDVFEIVVTALEGGLNRDWPLGHAIVHAQLTVMSQLPDSLIARKCGPEIAQRAADQAAAVLQTGTPADEAFWTAVADFDFWLRADGHRRNPGTTADLLAAGLFALLRDGIIKAPFRI